MRAYFPDATQSIRPTIYLNDQVLAETVMRKGSKVQFEETLALGKYVLKLEMPQLRNPTVLSWTHCQIRQSWKLLEGNLLRVAHFLIVSSSEWDSSDVLHYRLDGGLEVAMGWPRNGRKIYRQASPREGTVWRRGVHVEGTPRWSQLSGSGRYSRLTTRSTPWELRSIHP